MIEILRKILGLGPKLDLGQLIADGAVIVDVRTPGEYNSGHLKNSVNIPLDKLQAQMSKIKKEEVVITCCASGMRSASAKSILKSNGYQVYNGGSWMNLRKFER